MGAWESGVFDNDGAMDWVDELEESEGLEAIKSAFETVLEIYDDYLEVDEASSGLAAAETVAALLGKPAPNLPDEVADWVKGRAKPAKTLVTTAGRVVARVLQQSELRELWEETDAFDEWRKGIEDLKRRLGAT
jgi:hypothetical protein